MKTKRETGWNYFNLAFTAFGGLGMEVLYAYLLEPFLYKAQMQDWTGGQTIAHWILTCATWGIFGLWLMRSAKKEYGFDLMAGGSRMKSWKWAAVLFGIILSVTMQYIDWGGFKVLREFQGKGLLLFVFQYIYYAFETILFMLIVIFGQKACEIWLDRFLPESLGGKIPYGGIVCGLTWGLAHAFTKGSVWSGLAGIFWGFMMGTAYLLVNKNMKRTWCVMYLMFVL